MGRIIFNLKELWNVVVKHLDNGGENYRRENLLTPERYVARVQGGSGGKMECAVRKKIVMIYWIEVFGGNQVVWSLFY